jgi:hypothetical protein
MGLFSRNSTEVDTRPVVSSRDNVVEPRRSSRLFGSSSRETVPVTTTSRHSGSGFFNSSSRDNVSTSPTRRSGGGLFHRHEDASIVAARERVLKAEVAEKQADRALLEAKAMSRSAKHQTKLLEREAAEE